MKTENIVIVGGGSAGWMTAATLITAFPKKCITVVESPDVPTVGVGESTILGIRKWARYIGLDEKDFLKHTDGSYKLSIKFTNFYKKDSGGFHYPFGSPITMSDRNPVSDWHFKKFFHPETDVEDFVRCLFPSAALFENNKFTKDYPDIFDADDVVAYHFDATKFGIYLRDNICIPNGVKHVKNTVNHVETSNQGIDFIVCDNNKIFADLFVDCTGFKSLLLEQSLQEPFESYDKILPNNKAWATKIDYKDKKQELEGFTNCTAIQNGWCWNIPLWSRLGAGYVYSDRYVSDKQALEEFKNYLTSEKMQVTRTPEEVDQLEFKNISIKSGIHTRTFVKNVVAIGLSAGFIEPLESNGLFSVHEFLFKLTDILQRQEINQFDRDMYNISIRDMFDDFAKFVSLHYALSHRDDTEYWRDIQTRQFCDKHGDPYFPYIGRTDAYYNMSWRYMTEWGHPKDSVMNGITYISTGMHVFMMNKYRVDDLEYRTGRNFEIEINSIVEQWEQLKNNWQKISAESLSLYDYLKQEIHK